MSRFQSKTPLGRVRGLGSSHHGGQHWLYERFTSVALLLLSAWLIFSLLALPDFSRETVVEWLKAPLAAVPMMLFVITAFLHGLDGLKVVLDDYVHDDGNRVAFSFILTLLAFGGAAFALFALAQIVFGA